MNYKVTYKQNGSTLTATLTASSEQQVRQWFETAIDYDKIISIEEVKADVD